MMRVIRNVCKNFREIYLDFIMKIRDTVAGLNKKRKKKTHVMRVTFYMMNIVVEKDRLVK